MRASYGQYFLRELIFIFGQVRKPLFPQFLFTRLRFLTLQIGARYGVFWFGVSFDVLIIKGSDSTFGRSFLMSKKCFRP